MTDKIELQNIAEKKDITAGEVIDTPITSEMKKAYLDYAMSVIVSRALPDVRDGLKPVQRRIIYTAHEMNMTAESRYRKSATLVGGVIGKYHPHGDTSIYDAMVRMAQDFSLRYPLIDGQGNFGNRDGDSAAAMRYTECKLEKISGYLLKDIDKKTVPFVDNFSGEYKEPTVLPSTIPNLLMNGALGIAVGMATSIPPHNLGELIDGIIYILNKSKIVTTKEKKIVVKAYDLIKTEAIVNLWILENSVEIKDLAEIIKGPDFPTGCTIYDHSETLRYLTTGRGRIVQRGNAKIEEQKTGRFSIIITEIPYTVNKSILVEKIADLVTNKKIKGINDLRDESAKGKMRIVVELKRDSNPQKILNFLYKHTSLQTAFNANMLALVNNQPQVMGIKSMISEFITHRRDVITKRSLYLLQKAREREHILQGLKKALDHIDEVINIIKKSADQDDARNKLIKKYELSGIQAQAILDMQLKKLAALEREKIEDELKLIQKNINEILKLLATPVEMVKVIKTDFMEVKEKFADKRRTKVIKGKIGEFSEEDLVANEETLISITDSGYIKRMPPTTYKTQSRGGKGKIGMKTKEGDDVAMLRLAETHDRILFLTNLGRIYEKRVWDIPEASRQSKGTAVVNLLEMTSSENLKEVITINKDSDKQTDAIFLLTATKNGNIKKTSLSQFSNIRKTGIIAMGLKNEDQLVRAMLTNGKNDVILITANGQSIRFKEADVRPMGRSASGVRGIRLKGDDYVVSMEVVTGNKDEKLLTVSENGYGKLSKLVGYSAQKRGGSGLIAAKTNSKTGRLVSVKLITNSSDDILLTSESGQIIRIPLKSMSTLKRSTQGVIIMRLNGDDRVSAVTIFEKEE